MAVEEVGTGVGYLNSSSKASRVRLSGRGSEGEEESGSNAGRREVFGFCELRWEVSVPEGSFSGSEAMVSP